MKRFYILIILLVAICAVLIGQDEANEKAPFISSIRLTAGPTFPVGSAGSMYRIGGGGEFSAFHRLNRLPFLNFQAAVGFRGSPLLDESSTVLFTNLSVGAGLVFEIVPRFNFEAFINGGIYTGHLLDPATSGFGGQIAAGVLFDFNVSEKWSLGLGTSYRTYIGLASQISADLAASYRFDFKLDDPFRQLAINLEPYYPVLTAYYAGGMPIGRLIVANEGDATWKRIDVQFDIPGVSRGKNKVPGPEILTESQILDLSLIADFGDKTTKAVIGETTESKADIEFRYKGWPQNRNVTGNLSVYGASFVTDPRAAVLFVSSSDPVIKLWADAVTDIDLEVTAELNTSLAVLAAIYEALTMVNFNLTADGQDAWTEILDSDDSIRRFPFPRDTFLEGAGDRSESAILIASLLEAAGIPAGLAIIDGNLWPAAGLGEGLERIEAEYSRPEDLIVVEGIGWAVLDMSITGDFLASLASGAESWRKSGSVPVLVSCRESWKDYPQTGYSRDSYQVEIPDSNLLTEKYTETVEAMIRWEIASRQQTFLSAIENDPENTDLLNGLGALLARYGFREESVEWFDRVLLVEDDPRALVNMANVEYLRGDLIRARTYYNQASRVDPFNSYVLLGIARVSFEQQNFGNSRDAYSKLEIVDPDLADRFSVLTGTGPDALQAALDSELRRVVFWLE